MLPGDQRFVLKIRIQAKNTAVFLPKQDFIVNGGFFRG